MTDTRAAVPRLSTARGPTPNTKPAAKRGRRNDDRGAMEVEAACERAARASFRRNSRHGLEQAFFAG